MVTICSDSITSLDTNTEESAQKRGKPLSDKGLGRDLIWDCISHTSNTEWGEYVKWQSLKGKECAWKWKVNHNKLNKKSMLFPQVSSGLLGFSLFQSHI